jgi:rhodanese-related sulfurtransferase
MVRTLLILMLGMVILFLGIQGLDAASWQQHKHLALPIGITAGCLLFIALLLTGPKLMSDLRARGRQGVLDPIQVEEMVMGSSPLLVDIREVLEFKGKLGHIRGSVCMPYEELPQRFEELRSKDPRPLIIVDVSDKRAYEVSDFLRKQGFDWIYVLKGGLSAWRRERLPLYH